MGAATLLKRHTPESDEPKQRRKIGIVWIAVAVVVAACLVYLLIPSSDPTAPAAYTGPSVQVGASPDSNSATGKGPCNFPSASDGTSAGIAPADVSWSLVGSMASPSSASAGPSKTVDGVKACFARTPGGALMAASTYITAMADPSADKSAVLKHWVAHTAGRDQMLTQFSQFEGKKDPTEGQPLQQIVAFRFVFFDTSHTELEVVFRGSSGSATGNMASVVYVLVWENDDWKIAPVMDGKAPITQPVPSLDPPYIQFGKA